MDARTTSLRTHGRAPQLAVGAYRWSAGALKGTHGAQTNGDEFDVSQGLMRTLACPLGRTPETTGVAYPLTCLDGAGDN